MTNSAIGICNLALSHLGIGSITNIETPTTTTEIICQQYYDIARQTLYRDCFFQFSISQVVLPEDNTTPTFIFSKQSSELPQDFISLIYLYNGGIIPNNGKSYRIYSNRIQTDLTAPYNVLYVKDIKDVSKMTSDFKLLLSFYLALLVSESLGASADKKQYVVQMYTQLLTKAKANNGKDNSPIRINNSDYVDAFTMSSTNNNQTYF